MRLKYRELEELLFILSPHQMAAVPLQVLVNLVGNAIKFTARGSITVSLAVTMTTVRIVVTDTGVGISKAEMARLFQPFVQV
jgi:signal transduction histidine kinase